MFGFSSDSSKYDFNPINCILQPTETAGGLYLGDMTAASDIKILKKNNITGVLTVASGTDLLYNQKDIQYHKIIEAQDIEIFDLGKHFDEGIQFIHQLRENQQNVFVHCFAGVSRSVSMVIAYLMYTYRWTFQKSFKFVKDQRWQAYPNSGFIKQLKAFEKKLVSDNIPIK